MYCSWILPLAILGGCATYQPRPIQPAQLAQTFEQRSLTSDALRDCLGRQLGHPVESWPLPRWNRAMFTLVAICNSPLLNIARAQVDTANAGAEVAGARANPALQFPFEYATNSSAAHPYTTGPQLDIPLETGGKRNHRIDQAGYLAEAARCSLANEAWQVRSQVRDALLKVFATTQRSLFLSDKLERQRQILDMWRQREQLGAAARPDTRHAEIQWRQTQAELTAAELAQHDARASLATVIGLPFGVTDAAPLDLTEFGLVGTPPPAPAASHAAIFRRADLRGALAEYEARQAALQLEIAKQYPDVHIGAGYIYDAGTSKISLGLASVTLPLLDRNQGAIAVAEAKRSEAAARFAALQDGILVALEHALASYRDSRAALQAATANQVVARKQLDGVAARLAAGEVDRLTLAQAQSDYQTDAIERLAALVSAQQAAGMLEDAMQRPLALPLAPAASTDYIRTR